MHHWQGRPSLVFCSTRRGAQEAAVTLAETALKLGTQNPFIKSQEQYQQLQDAANLTNERQLQQCINCGVAFHNGGLALSDRNLVEGLFLKGDLQVLCTTNTLAHGVNLPAHSVIIKSTQY
jgi:ATP-dependent DNA helicase HFM1/MER3